MPDVVRWGVLSPAKIAVKKVIPAMQAGARSEVVAIASRDAARAQAAADALHLPHAFARYDALLGSDVVDAVYVPLPNHLHVPWAVRALEAGKHVLVEKPLARSAAEAAPLLDAAAAHPHLKVMEAFMYRFHPQWRRAKAWIDAGEVGALRTVHSHFSYHNVNPDDVRNRPETGGGGLLDIGCYDVSLSRFLFGREPRRVAAQVDVDPDFGTDRLASALLDFGDGATATFSCATRLAPHQRVEASGEAGRVELDVPFNAPPAGAVRARLVRGGEVLEHVERDVDQYTLQGDALSTAILEDRPVPTPLADGLANMRVLDAIRDAAATGAWADVPPGGGSLNAAAPT